MSGSPRARSSCARKRNSPACATVDAERRALPWVKVEKNYVFDGPDGTVTLADLFDGRSQLVVKHFMFGPDWTRAASVARSRWISSQGALMHLAQHDVSYAAVSRAPFAKIERSGNAWAGRSGGCRRTATTSISTSTCRSRPRRSPTARPTTTPKPPVVIDEMSGRSVFYRDESGQIFHTYSSFGRGGEMFLGSYAFLDITPKGRDETINGNLTDWVRHHDRYQVRGA